MKKSILIAAIGVFMTCSSVFAGNFYNKNIHNLSVGVSNDTVTVNFAVNGTAACKSTIETTLTSNTGVISASWDASSKIITVSYLTSKIKKSDLYTFLANAGYDNAELRAKTSIYAALPSNCQYTRDPDTE